jgi:NitT/TauT family transport system substrate-binding protein
MIAVAGTQRRAATMRYRRVASVFALILSGLFAAAHAEDQVTVRLKWFNQAQFAGFYVAKDKGIYKSAGLDVDVQPGGPDFPAIQMVAGGNEQFGVTGADQILIARSKGVPIVALAVIYRRNPFVLFSLAKSGIKMPADYIGKKVGLKIGGNEELIYRAVLAKAGIDKSKLTEIPVKFDMTPLLTGDIDVWPGYLINEVLAAKEKGFDVNIVAPSDYGVDIYADTLFTTEKMLKEKPDVVRKFVAATLQGWNSAIAAPEEAAKITVKYGDKLTYDHELAMMKASIPLLKPDDKPVGYMDATGGASAQQLLLGAGFQKDPVNVAEAFSAKSTP